MALHCKYPIDSVFLKLLHFPFDWSTLCYLPMPFDISCFISLMFDSLVKWPGRNWSLSLPEYIGSWRLRVGFCCCLGHWIGDLNGFSENRVELSKVATSLCFLVLKSSSCITGNCLFEIYWGFSLHGFEFEKEVEPQNQHQYFNTKCTYLCTFT